MAVFEFCPDSTVPETLPPEAGGNFTSASGWTFSARPTVPYARKFKLKLTGLRWYLDKDDLFDATVKPKMNARALEIFYAEHQTWRPFTYKHPHLPAPILCRFFAAVTVPAGMEQGGGAIDAVEVTLIEHNPGF